MRRTSGKFIWARPALLFCCLLFSVVTGVMSQEIQAEDNSQVKLLPEVEVLLPDNSPVKVNWVLPPVDRMVLETHQSDRWFTVDAEGFPWLGLDGRLLINPVKNYSAVLSESFTGLTHLSNGALIIATDEDFGFIAAEKELEYDPETGYPVLAYQPLAWLPGEADEPGEEIVSRTMFRGENCLYILVRKTMPEEDYREKYEVYCFKPGSVQGHGEAAGRVFPVFVPVYISDEMITAVTGDGEKTFIAHGQLVLLVTPLSNEPAVFYDHPAEVIVALDYSPEAGLFYATNYSVGLMSEGAALEFMKVPYPRIFLRGNSLYVMLSEQAAVILVENAGYLQRYNTTSREVVAVDEVKVSGGQAGISFLLFPLLGFVLLLVVLVDVLRGRFPGHLKTVWVLMVLVGYLALTVDLFIFLYFGLIQVQSLLLLLVPFLVVLVYLLSGRRQKIRD